MLFFQAPTPLFFLGERERKKHTSTAYGMSGGNHVRNVRRKPRTALCLLEANILRGGVGWW